MATYFAELDENKIVKRVIVADQKFIDSGAIGDPKNWVETFYDSGPRKNYAGAGYKYDVNVDAFIPPQPYKSWTLNKDAKWEPPIRRPEDTIEKHHIWSEEKKDWDALLVSDIKPK